MSNYPEWLAGYISEKQHLLKVNLSIFSKKIIIMKSTIGFF